MNGPISGARFGPFVLHEPIGCGSFAVVWRATHRSGEPVALKIAHSTDRDLEALRREGQRLAGLDHPAVVHVYDIGETDGHTWMALELAQGTLRDLESPIPVAVLVRHLLGGLQHVHARGWTHRDIKPTNILVGCRPRTGLHAADRAGIRLADFGVSWGSGESTLPLAGTAAWSAPEQLQGVAGAPADVYAVALVIQALVDGSIRAALGGWFARALAPDPAERFPTAAHALAAFPVVVGQTLKAWTPGGLEPTETCTRPVLLSILPQPLTCDPCPLMEPICPAHPPLSPQRVPRPRLLDAGVGLLSFRPIPPIGRQEVLEALWCDLHQGLPLRVRGSSEGIAEVSATLGGWAAELGIDADPIEHPHGRLIPELSPWHLVRRVEALGLTTRSATWLAMDCSRWPDLLARVRSLVHAGLLDITDEGLALRGARDGLGGATVSPETPARPTAPFLIVDVRKELEEAWWAADDLRSARALADHAQLLSTPEDRAWQLIFRFRLERRQGQQAADQLEAVLAELSGDVFYAGQVEMLRIFTSSKLSEGINKQVGVVSALPEPHEERLRASAEAQLAYARFAIGDIDNSLCHLDRACTLAGGRFRGLMTAMRVDIHLQRQEVQAAVATARVAISSVEEEHPDALVVRMSMINALVAAQADEREITLQIELGLPLLAHTLSRTAIARFSLFRAQQAMRQGSWEQADRMLTDAADLYRQTGGSAIFIILNLGLVGLHRADLASIAASTPQDWADQTERAAAYVRPLMVLHKLFAALGNRERIEAMMLEVEALPQLPEGAFDGIRLAADLGPLTYRERILALIG